MCVYNRVMEPTTWENVGKHYTDNGVLITEGLAVLDYVTLTDGKVTRIK